MAAPVRTFPFRVFSFPSEIRVVQGFSWLPMDVHPKILRDMLLRPDLLDHIEPSEVVPFIRAAEDLGCESCIVGLRRFREGRLEAVRNEN